MFILYFGVFIRIRQKSKFQKKSKSATKTPAKNSSTPNETPSRSSASSEARITKTLAIIMGVFVACWLPFFTIYIFRSQLVNPDSIPGNLLDVFIWLGYFNSAINPVLYAILNHNFRIAFQDILGCRCFSKKQKNNHMYKLKNKNKNVPNRLAPTTINNTLKNNNEKNNEVFLTLSVKNQQKMNQNGLEIETEKLNAIVVDETVENEAFI